MSSTDTISDDLPCRKCSYDLRGLSFAGRCPECGEPIRNSFAVAAAQLARLLNEHPQSIAHRLKFQGIADKTECTVDAVLFVMDAIEEFRRQKPAAVMDAALICLAVRSRAKQYFNDDKEARELLDEWGLRTGEDIGRIAVGLARHNLLQLTNDLTSQQFVELFSLKNEE
jgi:hypothetical protein